MRFTQAQFVFPGLNPTAFCQWATENFGADVTHQGGDCYQIDVPQGRTDPNANVWGAIQDIQKHKSWITRQSWLLLVPIPADYRPTPWQEWKPEHRKVILHLVRMKSEGGVTRDTIREAIESVTAHPVEADDVDLACLITDILADFNTGRERVAA